MCVCVCVCANVPQLLLLLYHLPLSLLKCLCLCLSMYACLPASSSYTRYFLRFTLRTSPPSHHSAHKRVGIAVFTAAAFYSLDSFAFSSSSSTPSPLSFFMHTHTHAHNVAALLQQCSGYFCARHYARLTDEWPRSRALLPALSSFHS